MVTQAEPAAEASIPISVSARPRRSGTCSLMGLGDERNAAWLRQRRCRAFSQISRPSWRGGLLGGTLVWKRSAEARASTTTRVRLKRPARPMVIQWSACLPGMNRTDGS